MPASLTLPGGDTVFPETTGVGWIHTWYLSREPSPPSDPGGAASRWLTDLLATLSLAHPEIAWTGWNPFRIQLPQAWREDEAGPLDTTWTEARAFHDRLEVRIRRTREAVRLHLLTEDVAVVDAAAKAGERWLIGARHHRRERFQTVPGRVLLVGRPLALQTSDTVGLRGEVRFPRLLRYDAPLHPRQRDNGTGTVDDTGGRVFVDVIRYLDGLYRLRAARYRRLGA